MRSRLSLRVVAALALLSVLALGILEVQSQQQRRRPSRRATNPARGVATQPPPATSPDYEPRVVSTAEEQAAQEAGQPTTNRTRRNRPAVPTPTPDETRRAMETLLEEFNRLNKKVDGLEKSRRTDLIQERLTRAEQRAEGLQTQLRDVLEKEANLQAATERIDDQMRPESIERQAALTGTFRPDELRESIRRQLDAEKRRVRAQLDVLNASRTRLETALASADQITVRLREQLEEATRLEAEGDEAATTPITTPAARPTPTPSETPPPR